MTRSKSQTIGHFGRAPARTSTPPFQPPPERLEEGKRGVVLRWIRGAFVDNVGLKFLSFVLAVTVFLLVNSDRDRERTITIPVTYTLPGDRVLTSDRLEAVSVTVRGPWRRIRRFDAGDVDPINLDLRHTPSGDMPVTADLVHVPTGLTITTIKPSSVHVNFEKKIDKIVEVTPKLVGHLPHGYVTTGVKITPATVKVRGAEGLITALASVRTRDIDLDDQHDSFDTEIEAAVPDGVELVGAKPMTVHISVDEELVTRKVLGQAVELRGDGIDTTKWTMTPVQVEVTLTGTLLAVERAKDQMKPVVKLTAADAKDPKTHDADIVLVGLPPGVGAKISPERVKVTPPAPPPKP